MTGAYHSWAAMKTRCNNVHDDAYHLIGGKGITYCTNWEEFEIFLQDMGEQPFDGACLGRIDHKGPYTKDNCKWMTKTEVVRASAKLTMHKARVIRLLHKTGIKSYKEIAVMFNISRTTVQYVVMNKTWKEVPNETLSV